MTTSPTITTPTPTDSTTATLATTPTATTTAAATTTGNPQRTIEEMIRTRSRRRKMSKMDERGGGGRGGSIREEIQEEEKEQQAVRVPITATVVPMFVLTIGNLTIRLTEREIEEVIEACQRALQQQKQKKEKREEEGKEEITSTRRADTHSYDTHSYWVSKVNQAKVEQYAQKFRAVMKAMALGEQLTLRALLMRAGLRWSGSNYYAGIAALEKLREEAEALGISIVKHHRSRSTTTYIKKIK
ncbi:MAG: hypothetical protein QXM92_03200 [Candidatus Anstonellales archaeon]